MGRDGSAVRLGAPGPGDPGAGFSPYTQVSPCGWGEAHHTSWDTCLRCLSLPLGRAGAGCQPQHDPRRAAGCARSHRTWPVMGRSDREALTQSAEQSPLLPRTDWPSPPRVSAGRRRRWRLDGALPFLRSGFFLPSSSFLGLQRSFTLGSETAGSQC